MERRDLEEKREGKLWSGCKIIIVVLVVIIIAIIE